MKDIGGLRKLRHRGLRKVKSVFVMAATVFNIVRLVNLEVVYGITAPI